MTTFWMALVSTFGPACIRRCSAAGSVRAMQRVGTIVAAIVVAMKTHACQ